MFNYQSYIPDTLFKVWDSGFHTQEKMTEEIKEREVDPQSIVLEWCAELIQISLQRFPRLEQAKILARAQ